MFILIHWLYMHIGVGIICCTKCICLATLPIIVCMAMCLTEIQQHDRITCSHVLNTHYQYVHVHVPVYKWMCV